MQSAPQNPFVDDLPAPDEARRKRVNKRLLWGCGLGCLLPILLIVGLFAYGQRLLSDPGTQIESDRVLGDTSDGFMQLSPSVSEAELMEWIAEIVERIGDLPLEDYDTDATQGLYTLIEQFGSVEPGSIKSSGEFLPGSLTSAFTVDDQGVVQLVMAIRLAAGGRISRMLFEYVVEDEDGTQVFGEHLIKPLNSQGEAPSAFLTFFEDTPLIATDLAELQRTLTLLDSGLTPSSPSYSALIADWNRVRDSALLSAAFGFQRELSPAAVRAWFRLFDAELVTVEWPDVTVDRMRFTLDIKGNDVIARFDLVGLPGERLPECEAFATAWIADLKASLAAEGIELAADQLSGPDSLVIDVRILNLRSWLGDRIIRAIEAERESAHSIQVREDQ